MKHLKKNFIALLSLSNVLVLGLVFNVYFGNSQKIYLFSLAENLEDLKQKIQQDCAEDFSKILNGLEKHFICQVDLDQSHKGVSYKFKAEFKVSQQGDSIRITEIVGKLRDKKDHITEAHFCNDCFNERSLDSSSNMEELMTEVSDLVEDMYNSAQDSVEEAYNEEKQSDSKRRLAKIRERECEGFWNEESQIFEEFTQAGDRLHCRLNQIHEMDSLLEIEQFYHEKLKKQLWNVALSEEEKASLTNEFFDSFHSPYRYSLSVRSSMALLENYTRWKEDFDILESLRDKQLFLKEITQDVRSLMSFMSSDQFEQDLYYLNQGFDGLYKKLEPADINSQKSIPSPNIDYETVSEEVKKLY